MNSHAACSWITREWDVMTTRAYVEACAEASSTSKANAENAIDAIVAEYARINAVFSPWIDTSELAKINANAARKAVVTTDEVFAMFEKSGEFNMITGGAFDASFASAGVLYDYRKHIAPDNAALAKAQKAIGWFHVVLDADKHSIRYLHPKTRVDFGGIAKGYAIDHAVKILRDHGITNAYVSLGGDSFALGDRDERPWQIGIRHPRDLTQTPVMIPAENLAISTSGDYERFFDRNGERVHHILSPQTGKPVHGVVSVTILADDSTTADALSTGVFVMGREEGLALVNKLGNVSAVIIAEDGQVYYSNDLEPAQ